jgi:hypothetical protein
MHACSAGPLAGSLAEPSPSFTVTEDSHRRRTEKEGRENFRRSALPSARSDLIVCQSSAPVLAAAVALATAEAVPRQLMVGESGSAYRLPSQGEEPDWSGQPEGARASAREPLGTLWW